MSEAEFRRSESEASVKPVNQVLGFASRVFRVALPFTAAYLVSELIRNVNAVLAPILRAEFDLGSTTMGLMTAAFLGALAGSQLFIGQALDRFGPKRVLVSTLILAIAASVLFALAQTSGMLIAGRFLLGLGLCACWTGAYKANALWWPRERLPLVNAMTIGAAGLGALAATAPTEWLLGLISWREMFLGIAALAGGIALLIGLAVPRMPVQLATHGIAPPLPVQGIRGLVFHPAFLAIVPASALCQGAWVAYQGLWAGVWLREGMNIDSASAAEVLFCLALAVMAGQFAFGLLADRIARGDSQLFRLTFTLTLGFVLVQVAIAFSPQPFQGLLWAGYGLFTAGPILAYALLVRLLPDTVTGRAIALLNFGAVMTGFLLQSGLGAGIDLLVSAGWTSSAAQTALLGGVALLQALALLWMAIRRNTVVGA